MNDRKVHPMERRKVSSFSVIPADGVILGAIGPMGFEMDPEFAARLGRALIDMAGKVR